MDLWVDELERGQCAGDERGSGGREGGQAETPDLARTQCRQRLLGFLDGGEDREPVLAQQQCGVGGPDPAARPFEQGAPGLTLERRHVLAYGRRREVESGGGSGDRSPCRRRL